MFEQLVNGQPSGYVAGTDRGLLYGDGLFETVKIMGGSALRFSDHMARLKQGCERLAIHNVPYDAIATAATTRVKAYASGVLKVVVTRGPGGRGYRPPEPDSQVPTWLVQIHPLLQYPDSFRETGIAVYDCTTRVSRNRMLAGIKHLNRLEQVMARNEWIDPSIPEGLMRDDLDRVIGGTMTNLFIVKHGRLMTPDLGECGVAGVTRQFIINRCAQQGLECVVSHLTTTDLETADEIFVCNSVVDVWPVRLWRGKQWTVGPLTSQVARWVQTWLNDTATE